MGTMKITPGKWILDPHDKSVKVQYVSRGKMPEIIVECIALLMPVDHGSMAANAALITAAPKLLRCAKEHCRQCKEDLRKSGM